MKTYTGTLTPRPSMICRKLNYTGKIDPESTEIAILHTTPNIQFGYDVENGDIKVTLNSTNFKESVKELRSWMEQKKVPITYEGDSMFFIDASDLFIDDIPMLEECGFVKRDVINGNSVNFIWEMK